MPCCSASYCNPLGPHCQLAAELPYWAPRRCLRGFRAVQVRDHHLTRLLSVQHLDSGVKRGVCGGSFHCQLSWIGKRFDLPFCCFCHLKDFLLPVDPPLYGICGVLKQLCSCCVSAQQCCIRYAYMRVCIYIFWALGQPLADSCQSAFTAAVWCCAWLLAFRVAARVAAGFLLPLGSLP